jgi:hypothetical protein
MPTYTNKTIRDLHIGTSYRSDAAGAHTLKGFDGDWQLFRIGTG